jgi:hypothetical protein
MAETKTNDQENGGSPFSLEITERTIDLKSVIHSKSPKLARTLPGFILNYLKRIIHEKEINDALWHNKDKYGIDFARSILKEIGIETTGKNHENIPETGRYLIASNHPLGGPDGLALISEVGKVRQDIIFPVNDLLMNLPNLKDIVHTHKQTWQQCRKHQNHSTILLLPKYPPGFIFLPDWSHRKIKGKIEDLEWKIDILSVSQSATSAT